MNRRLHPTAARGGELMDEAARLTPCAFDFSIQWSARDVISQRDQWVAGWYPNHRSHLSGDTLLDATVMGRGDTAADALLALLGKRHRLPRTGHEIDANPDDPQYGYCRACGWSGNLATLPERSR